MILYLDASALVKRYVTEPGSSEVSEAINRAEMAGTALVSRAEVAAALAKAARVGTLTQEEALASLRAFRTEWPHAVRVQVTEMVVAQADALAWEHGLRGYDAIHLAAAAFWQDALGQPVTMATFDHQLWVAAGRIGLEVCPSDLPTWLERTWREDR